MNNRNALLAIGLVVALGAGFLVVWSVQAHAMQRDLQGALRAGNVASLPPNMADRKWSDAELATARVIKLVRRYDYRLSLEKWIHTRGDGVLSPERYSYQGSLTDSSGIRFVLGYRRAAPGGWTWEGVHPASAAAYIEQRVPRAQ